MKRGSDRLRNLQNLQPQPLLIHWKILPVHVREQQDSLAYRNACSPQGYCGSTVRDKDKLGRKKVPYFSMF